MNFAFDFRAGGEATPRDGGADTSQRDFARHENHGLYFPGTRGLWTGRRFDCLRSGRLLARERNGSAGLDDHRYRGQRAFPVLDAASNLVGTAIQAGRSFHFPRRSAQAAQAANAYAVSWMRHLRPVFLVYCRSSRRESRFRAQHFLHVCPSVPVFYRAVAAFAPVFDTHARSDGLQRLSRVPQSDRHLTKIRRIRGLWGVVRTGRRTSAQQPGSSSSDSTIASGRHECDPGARSLYT